MNVRIQRIELYENNHVKAIEFYIDSSPLQVIEFLAQYHIGAEFASFGDMKLETNQVNNFTNLHNQFIEAIGEPIQTSDDGDKFKVT